jgi:flagellar hook-associated protein 1 FlgK
MSLNTAMQGAMSGLRAAGRATALVSENLANAMNPDYARRSLHLSANAVTGAGVKVVGVTRHADPVLIAGRLSSESESAATKIHADFWTRAQQLIGGPDDETALSQALNHFEAAAITSASLPPSEARLQSLAFSARNLAQHINDAAHGIQDLRTNADREIARLVDVANDGLQNVAQLNRRIRSAHATGSTVEGLVDQRQTVIDQINEIIPVKILDKGNGQVALYATGGAILLDGTAGEIEFTATNVVTPYLSQAAGTLSGLNLNGNAINAGPQRHTLGGGALQAQFELRDKVAVELQNDLDTYARDLVERFQDPALDTSLAVTDPGLFTDANTRFDPADTQGLSYRLSLNNLVDPSGSAEFWRLRDGLGAASPGSVGNAGLLNGYLDALASENAASSTAFSSANETASGFAAVLQSVVSSGSARAQSDLTFATAVQSEMTRLSYEQGVDTDAELQTMLILEKSYAANARLISIVDDLMEKLLRI